MRLDILSVDTINTQYNTEVQRDSRRASPKRARYNGSLLDTKLLNKRQDMTELPDRYTIFITEEDVIGGGLPIYHAENRIKELDYKPLGDGAYIIYVNGEFRDTSNPIGSLMHDFFCVNPEEILNDTLRERVTFLKSTEKGREYMSPLTESIITDELMNAARRFLLLKKNTTDEIADCLSLPIELVEQLDEEINGTT